jgi:pimeloyl-ACP methyl ester carboxylesterase
MERAVVGGITPEYEVSGMGEPVVFIHGSFIADTFRPLVTETALARRYSLITYHRRGYPGSSQSKLPLSIPEQATDCLALLRNLGVDRVDVVGHSFGGAVALQIALDAPAAIRSLALLEPALMVGATG